MIDHYLKIAFRNLWKYKTQNIISIIGLAVGFTCFALSLFWIQYERSYDNFHSKADRIYRVRLIDKRFSNDSVNTQLTPWLPYNLVDILKSDFPEVEDACGISEYGEMELKIGKKYNCLMVDPSFCKIFDIPFSESFFAVNTETPSAMVTEKAVKGIFGTTQPLGDTIKSIRDEKYEVKKIIKEWPTNTNYPFDILLSLKSNLPERFFEWGYNRFHIYVLLKPNADISNFENKLKPIKVDYYENLFLEITPIKELHHKKPDLHIEKNVKFNHISIFAFSGILIIFCALFNYLTLFMSRVKMKGKEFALRKVNGSSNGQIILMLLCELLLVVILSFILGYFFMGISISKFIELSQIQLNISTIIAGTVLYALLLLILLLLIGIILIQHFYKKGLYNTMYSNVSPKFKNGFHKISLLLQLIISIGFMFCATVFIKQIHYLNHTDLGMERNNLAEIVRTDWDEKVNVSDLVNNIKKTPYVTDLLETSHPGFMSHMSFGSWTAKEENSSEEKKSKSFLVIECNPHFFDFYKITLLEGRLLSDLRNEAVINETAAKEMGDNPLGKPIYNDKIIVGIVKDFYYESPTTPVKPTIICHLNEIDKSFRHFVYKYKEGYKKESEAAIQSILQKDYPGENPEFSYSDDLYDEYLKSEKQLLLLLEFMTTVCIIIAAFGIYSLVDLTCQQRRKEIAIRKVNGATVSDVLQIFFSECLVLLLIASLIAFPLGYQIIHTWLEQYIKQTSIDWWIYAGIILFVAIVVFLTIGSKVWKAANQNPAEVVKSE